MNLLKIIKRFLFIQNFFSSLVSKFPAYLEFSLGKYLGIKKAMYITAHDQTYGSYLEFGVFTGSSFNFAMKVNKNLDKLLGNSNCDFVGFDSFQGFGKISQSDEHPMFKDETFEVDEIKILKNIKKCAAGQKYQIIKKVKEIEKYFKLNLYKFNSYDFVTNTRYLGAIGVIEVKHINFKKLVWLRNEFIKRGIWARPLRNVIYFMPPFIIKKKELEKIFRATEDIFQLWEKKIA